MNIRMHIVSLLVIVYPFFFSKMVYLKQFINLIVGRKILESSKSSYCLSPRCTCHMYLQRHIHFLWFAKCTQNVIPLSISYYHGVKKDNNLAKENWVLLSKLDDFPVSFINFKYYLWSSALY